MTTYGHDGFTYDTERIASGDDTYAYHEELDEDEDEDEDLLTNG